MIRSVVATAGIRFALTALALVTSILTARYLGQDGRGDYFFIVTLTAVLVQLTVLGLPQSNTFLVAHDRSTRGPLTTNSAWIAICVTGGAGAALALGAPLLGMLEDTPTSFLWLAAALAPPSVFYMLGTNILVGLDRIRAYNAAEIGSRLLVFVALLAVGAAGAGAGGFVVAAILAWTVAAVGVGVLLARGTRLRPTFDAAMFRRGFRYAAKAYLVTLLGFLVLRSNIFLLRREWGPGELGIYSVAAQMSDVLFILPQTISLILFPRLVREASTRWSTTLRASSVVLLTTAVAAIVTALVARPLIGLLFGAEFEPAANVLYIMLPGIVMLATAGVFGQYLGAIGLPRLYVFVWAGALVVVTTLSLVLIPRHAGAGAAASLTVTYTLFLAATGGLAFWYHRRHPHDDGIGRALPIDGEDLTPAGE